MTKWLYMTNRRLPHDAPSALFVLILFTEGLHIAVIKFLVTQRRLSICFMQLFTVKISKKSLHLYTGWFNNTEKFSGMIEEIIISEMKN